MRFSLLLASSALLATSAIAQTADPVAPGDGGESKADWELYGFAQIDLISDFGGRMNPDWVDAFRPSRIATPEGQ